MIPRRARREAPAGFAGVCVTTRRTQPDAVEEACRRLTVMAQKWPQTRYRMRVQRRRDADVPRWWVWEVICLIPDGARVLPAYTGASS